MTEDQLLDLTPELKQEALEIASRFRLGPLFTPPTLEGTLQLPSTGGGANWPGAAVDPESGVLYVPASNSPGLYPLSKPDPARSNLDYTGSFFADAGSPQGLPLNKPPWGTVTAIDLNTGEHLWQTANGNGPRSHPALRGLDLPMLGNGSGGPLVTKTLLFVTQTRGYGDENPPGINVFDKATGEYLGIIELPDVPHSNPVTYVVAGKQYLVVATGGGPFFAITEDIKDVAPDWAERVESEEIPEGPTGTPPRLVALALP
jgi:quinoprotein glucose dehydrogenase